jgi:hypothetical protein
MNKDRREFLKTAGIAAAGSLSLGYRPGAGSAEEAASKRPRLFSGCCAYSYLKYLKSGKMSMEDFIKKFRDCVSFSARPVPPENLERVIDLIDRLEKANNVGQVMRLLAPFPSGGR